MAATAQIGTSLILGFGDTTLTGYVMQDVTVEGTGETKVIKDVNNATMTILSSDLGTRRSIKALILTANGTLTPPAKNSIMAINSVNYRVESASVAMTNEEAVLSATVIKEASMTY